MKNFKNHKEKMSVRVSVRMSKIMCTPIKVGIRTYATYVKTGALNIFYFSKTYSDKTQWRFSLKTFTKWVCSNALKFTTLNLVKVTMPAGLAYIKIVYQCCWYTTTNVRQTFDSLIHSCKWSLGNYFLKFWAPRHKKADLTDANYDVILKSRWLEWNSL